MNYDVFKLTLGVIATVGLYSVLYRENRFYRFFEHLFLGLAAGYSLTALWTEALKSTWWDKMVGTVADSHGSTASSAFPAYMLLLPIAAMGYFVFSKKHNWISRIPIGIILGLYSGQQIDAWKTRYLRQIAGTMKPVIPTTTEFFKPVTSGLAKADVARIDGQVYGSQALSNLIFVITVVSVLSYFLFSFDIKNKLILRTSVLGRWLLMIGFGAIFGTTVMMRFTLLIDRMYFIWIEWFQQAILHR